MRRRCFEAEFFPGYRMFKCQNIGMKAGAAQRVQLGTIFFVAGYRMAQLFHVYPYLILPAGFQLYFQERELIVSFSTL